VLFPEAEPLRQPGNPPLCPQRLGRSYLRKKRHRTMTGSAMAAPYAASDAFLTAGARDTRAVVRRAFFVSRSPRCTAARFHAAQLLSSHNRKRRRSVVATTNWQPSASRRSSSTRATHNRRWPRTKERGSAEPAFFLRQSIWIRTTLGYPAQRPEANWLNPGGRLSQLGKRLGRPRLQLRRKVDVSSPANTRVKIDAGVCPVRRCRVAA
jgi:hypothetical protein